MKNLLGVVLCGGESRRMGTDKGLLLKDNKPWALYVADKLKTINLSVAISINEKQQDEYQTIFIDTPLIIDHMPIDGPLDGLLSIHRNFPEKDILLMACDLIDMDMDSIQVLIDTYQTEPGFDYYVYQQNGFTQPFCAIYTATALSAVFRLFEENQLKRYSLHDRFESGNTRYLEIANEAGFKNYNNL